MARLIRSRWGVENNNHHTFDAALDEDDRPWFQEHPIGALKVIILRRLAYDAMSLYRARTLRAEAHRLMPWRDLTRQVLIALITATEATVSGLRSRAPPKGSTHQSSSLTPSGPTWRRPAPIPVITCDDERQPFYGMGSGRRR